LETLMSRGHGSAGVCAADELGVAAGWPKLEEKPTSDKATMVTAAKAVEIFMVSAPSGKYESERRLSAQRVSQQGHPLGHPPPGLSAPPPLPAALPLTTD